MQYLQILHHSSNHLWITCDPAQHEGGDITALLHRVGNNKKQGFQHSTVVLISEHFQSAGVWSVEEGSNSLSFFWLHMPLAFSIHPLCFIFTHLFSKCPGRVELNSFIFHDLSTQFSEPWCEPCLVHGLFLGQSQQPLPRSLPCPSHPSLLTD